MERLELGLELRMRMGRMRHVGVTQEMVVRTALARRFVVARVAEGGGGGGGEAARIVRRRSIHQG